MYNRQRFLGICKYFNTLYDLYVYVFAINVTSNK